MANDLGLSEAHAALYSKSHKDITPPSGRTGKYSAPNFLDPPLCFTPDTLTTTVGLPESCPKNGDVPKSPFPTVAAVGAIGWHNSTLKIDARVRMRSASAFCKSTHGLRRASLIIGRRTR